MHTQGESSAAERQASLAIAVLLIYYEIFRWFHNDQFWLDIVIGLLLCMMIWDFRKNHIVQMWVGVVALALWVAAHLQSWWIPYPFGIIAGANRELLRSKFREHVEYFADPWKSLSAERRAYGSGYSCVCRVFSGPASGGACDSPTQKEWSQLKSPSSGARIAGF